LWTKDNEGRVLQGRAGFQTRSISTPAGEPPTRVREGRHDAPGPVTPENNVDMIINVILSQITSETINTQRVRTELDTTTNMVVQDGQTIMLGGMLFQEDSRIKRKIPLLGDIPLVGGLFQHNQGIAANSELLIFVTPLVIDMPDKSPRLRLEQARRRWTTSAIPAPPVPDQE
jgi:type II secretory pathway component GspD/PulD (secretin)